MSTQKLVNISLSDFRKFLNEVGCTNTRTNGGHEIWEKEGLTRPLILQTHKDPVPPFIAKSLLRDLGLTSKDYFDAMKK